MPRDGLSVQLQIQSASPIAHLLAALIPASTFCHLAISVHTNLILVQFLFFFVFLFKHSLFDHGNMAPKNEGDGLSAFERRRLENIAANKALLSEISVTAKKIIPDKPVSKSSTPRKRVKAEPVVREPRRGTRMSSRLAGVAADDEVLKRKLEVEAEHQAEQVKAKRLRIGDDMNLGDIIVDGKKYTSSMDGLKGIFRGAQPGVRTFEYDAKEATGGDLKELRRRMNGLKLYEHWIPNGRFPRISLVIAALTPNFSHRHQNHAPKSVCARLPSNRRQADCVCGR